ncbi:MAG: hypothetical protein ABSF76_09475 [Opitutaceae bacterium]|jgi:hypothetical protein
MALTTILYVGTCALVAYFGRERKFGFWGYFAASVVFLPIIGLLLVLASDKKARPAAAAPAA